MSKTYYYHTTKLEATKMGLVPACTIALRKDGDKFVYGVSICSRYDNFSRKYGREVAENRLNQGFGIIDIAKIRDFKTHNVDVQSISDHQMCMQQLFNLVISVVKKNKKWKKRITRFNLTQKVGSEIGK